MMMMSKEKLIVEVVAAHNLMPKDGEGSSSPFVEVEFENQRLRTQSKHKDLNPVWNERLVFNVSDLMDLPYRTIEVNVFNEKKSGNNRNFLGKVRVPGSSVARRGEEIPQLFTLEKRSLFSHIKGEISLKMYYEEGSGGGAAALKGLSSASSTVCIDEKKAAAKRDMSTGATANHHVEQPKQQKQDEKGKHVELPKQPDVIKPTIIITGGGGGELHPSAGSAGSWLQNDYGLKETNPHLGGVGPAVAAAAAASGISGNATSTAAGGGGTGGNIGGFGREKTGWAYDLVEQMQYLYVRVVKARELGVGSDALVEVKVGNYRGITKQVEKRSNPEWDQVFAFSKDCIQSSVVEVMVKDKDEFLGRVIFDLSEVPVRVPPDSPLAPQWYRMEDKKGESKVKGEVMVSVWMGTQADEAFSEAWHSKAASVPSEGLNTIKSKVYLSPKLWYLRVTVLEAQDLFPTDKGRFPELSVKVQVGSQVLRTRSATARSVVNPSWNEDLMFVVAEPFEDYVMLVVEDRVVPSKEEILGRLVVPLGSIERRLDDKSGTSRWFNLDRHHGLSEVLTKSSRFGSRIHLKMCLEGGYHVLDESTLYSSDLRPTAKQLWKPNIGVLEIGILGANGLLPMKLKDGRGTTDAYCVAKYGQKWVRTRTVVDSVCPKWNEQYTWEVFDPCTVITIGVFDNCHLDKGGGGRDLRVGKVRIRLSTLECDRVYTHAYPLLVLHPSGVKKMGELHLALRFSCSSMANMLHIYSWPLLPKMHYTHPLSVSQLESLRYQAMTIVAMRLNRAEPPLHKEVVEYMLDIDSHVWSMRRSKANFFRLVTVLSGFVSVGRWIESVCSWRKPVVSVLVMVLFLIFVCYPELILPTLLLYMFAIGIWRYRQRPRQPPHMDTRLSHAESVFPDELDEEFDTFPTSRGADVLRMRYDRLRSVAGRVQTVVGDVATQGERVQALLSWRDPRATFLFVIMCLVGAVGFYAVPFQVVVACAGVYMMRPPRFRSRLPSPALSFFRRLPARADALL
ncbi:FT-interacting protein 3-like [Nymphaea colorata]|uniref:C2 domain-containing protein n=1 Tax=Nymphaea colorata TaxID=210225 RepID=A0A5K0YPM4_9MAGN|nr:FT-interacting protein 3-like [Nymphaea colorata]VVV79410.1 unnamed protein product [Nymphaea colorata]